MYVFYLCSLLFIVNEDFVWVWHYFEGCPYTGLMGDELYTCRPYMVTLILSFSPHVSKYAPFCVLLAYFGIAALVIGLHVASGGNTLGMFKYQMIHFWVLQTPPPPIRMPFLNCNIA